MKQLGALLATAALASGSALAQSPCTPISGQELKQPGVIRPQNGVLDTILVVDNAGHGCVPVWDNTTHQWTAQTMNLRTYGWPTNGDRNKLQWTIPGPTLRVKKTYLKDSTQPPGSNNPVTELGTVLKLGLYNQLPNNSYPYNKCDPASVTQPTPDGGTIVVPQPPAGQLPHSCFHGADVTNIHYHGTHVSPQPGHDFVLLSLYSSKQTNPPPPPSDTYNQVGFYQTELGPFPWNQAPGTHWYHPHKHGATALQVLNGMSGALLIQGPFDDWLYALYKVNPDDETQLQKFEKVMLVQQIMEDLNFYNPATAAPPKPLVNGQASPVIKMRPGEIQRWRLIGATMQASAALEIGFPPGFEVRQIAQDGVQFAWQNYDRQPLIAQGLGKYKLAPGNRADLLVKAPTSAIQASAKATKGGRHHVTFRVFAENLDADVKGHLKKRAAVSAVGDQVLFSVQLDGTPVTYVSFPVTESTDPTCKQNPKPAKCWPDTPYFLKDLPPAQTTRTVPFSMRDPSTNKCTANGQQPNGFWINHTQFKDGCAEYTMTLGTTEEWTVSNDSPLPHPFHIHTNPFQVISYGPTTPQGYGPPYVWQDTIALPVGAKSKVDPNCNELQSVTIRHKFEDYTGPYVLHCHFLGHEDRGMMLNVQTVCPGSKPTWGRPQLTSADNCSLPTAALPSCSATGNIRPAKGHAH